MKIHHIGIFCKNINTFQKYFAKNFKIYSAQTFFAVMRTPLVKVTYTIQKKNTAERAEMYDPNEAIAFQPAYASA